ncbi:MAG: RT0821/Lpp0805 family surface protein [Alphaproteobacteria bacterium]|nr:RT0821/Lpp0805 family surface protein [Alphaproteobacteria bacterium]MCZ6510276.1 RT0821/Lpp0805 family surface protein [Alphaproteobacteria bacterium]MCZ6593195.1 RT0821/Lpp0805 family surface protein [Alphaproteobacteria bacterium]MCZ6844362.1 RT0821/Lpp0805 family surface protein [Alphaproteobacteria bacterium]
MQIKVIAPLAAAALILGACTGDAGQKQTAGTIIGGIGGAVIGSQIGSGSGQLVATALGTFAGALIGADIGKSLDRADQLAMRQAEQQAHSAPIGDQIVWNNPDSGNSGSVTPVREGTNARSGAYCREYQTKVTVGGREQRAYGTACQQPDGSWQVVS